MVNTQPLARLKHEWLGNIRGDLLSGIVVALALIPEAIAFSIIAGVDPKVGLYASFIIAIITSIAGGRPGMISAATGAMALLIVTLVKDHGVEYLFAATVLAGVLQLVFGWLKLGRYMRFVPKPVMLGFVNALAILIFIAQLEHFVGANPLIYLVVLIGLAVIYLLPRLTTIVPAPLVAIVGLTLFAVYSGSPLATVGDMGELPSALPFFSLPAVPFSLETLMIILPYAVSLALVGLVESLLTASIVDDLTDTGSDKNRESKGQGIANVVTGFFGGMAGCAMIGQSIINVTSGGRGRLSSLTAGVFLLFLIMVLGDAVRVIPMGALVAVMIMVSINTFDWRSLTSITRAPLTDTIVMVSTVAVVLATNNLALGVLVGVLLSTVFFARKVAKLVTVSSKLDETRNQRTYRVEGQLFFVSSEEFLESFDTSEELDEVTIDLTNAHLWDVTAVEAVDKLTQRFEQRGTRITLEGLNAASETLLKQLAPSQQQEKRDS
jgi:SulP family sulfate permease